MARSKTIDIGVSQRVLWIGSEAYPLHNIARAQTARLVPRRGKAVGAYLKAVLVAVVVGVGGPTAMRLAGVPKPGFRPDRDTLTRYLAVAALAVVALSTARLLFVLAQRTMYALVIETSGTPRTALVSPDEPLLHQLVRNIMAAVNNPHAEFHQQVNHYHGGNHVNQYGPRNIGMVNR